MLTWKRSVALLIHRQPRANFPRPVAPQKPYTTSRKPNVHPARASPVAKNAEQASLSLIIDGSERHHDLRSLEDYAVETGLNKSSTVYVGVHYEYSVIEALKPYGFVLKRVGRASDKGIDVIGHWHLPDTSTPNKAVAMRVLIQCKAAKPSPSMIRELEGTVAGAPSEWRQSGVLVMLAASKEATKGVRDAITRSSLPMAFLNISGHPSKVRQFLWNQSSAENGLQGITATMRYDSRSAQETRAAPDQLCLTCNGLPWRPEGIS